MENKITPEQFIASQVSKKLTGIYQIGDRVQIIGSKRVSYIESYSEVWGTGGYKLHGLYLTYFDRELILTDKDILIQLDV